jgi:hypothetical protein
MFKTRKQVGSGGVKVSGSPTLLLIFKYLGGWSFIIA